MIKILAIVSLLVTILGAASEKALEIFGLTSKDVGNIVIEKEVEND